MRLNYTLKTRSDRSREPVLLRNGFVARRIFIGLLIYLVFIATNASTDGNSLTQICDQLDRYDTAQHYQTGTEMCRKIGGSDDTAVTNEEDPLIQEKYLRLRANLCQGLADNYARSPENHKVVSEEAFHCWEDYFQWFQGVGSQTQSKILSARVNEKHVWGAAAALGTTALSAEKPENAWTDYESLKKEWFGSQALSWWLATLVSPYREKKVNDTIFATLSDNKELLQKAVLDAARTEHWRRFAKMMPEVMKTGRFNTDMYNTFLDHLKAILPPDTASAERAEN